MLSTYQELDREIKQLKDKLFHVNCMMELLRQSAEGDHYDEERFQRLCEYIDEYNIINKKIADLTMSAGRLLLLSRGEI